MSKVREAAIVHFPLLTIKGDFFSDREKTHLRILKGSLQKKKGKKKGKKKKKKKREFPTLIL